MSSGFGPSFSGNVNSFNVSNSYNLADDKSRVLEWLSPLEPQKRHQDVRIRRLDGTGGWLLETPEFQKWCHGEDGSVTPTLFCYGDPGAGKTHMSSLVVDTLCDQIGEKDVGVACLYCDFHAQEEQVATSMMGGILKQLVAGMDETPKEIDIAFQQAKGFVGGRGLRLPDILTLLGQTLGSFRRTFICIDGLDEYAAERRPELLRSLQQVIRDSPTTRLFLAGRSHLREEVKKHLSESISYLAIKPHESDIRRYISMKMCEDPDPDAMDDELESEIMASVCEKSSDIFLLVALQIDAVLGETSIHRRRQKLHQQTNDLHDVYATTLDRISRQRGDKPRLGMAVLLWVSLAQRPLSASELCDALGVEIGSADINTQNIPPIQTLLGSCLGLVTVDKETSRVRLIHSTLQEYLQAHTTLFHNAHAKIAEVCLTYLNFSTVRALSRSIETAPSSMPFLVYASYHWGYHAGKEMTESVRMRALSVLEDYENHASGNLHYFSNGYESMEISEEGSPLWGCIEYYWWRSSSGRTGSGISGLHCAVLFGLGELVSSLMELKSTHINQQDFGGCTPLTRAVRHRNDEIFELLLRDPNIHPDVSDIDGETPLYVAALLGNELMVKRLLSIRDVNPDSKNSWGRTPLCVAASRGHANIVKLLLGRVDVDPYAKTRAGDAPLHLAARGGNEDIARLFLNLENSNPNTANNHGNTPLSIAAQYGHIGIVKMLLAMDDIDLNPRDGDGDTPILAASYGGGEDLVKLLFDWEGIERNIVNNRAETLLHMAVRGGQEPTVKFLLEQGDIDTYARDWDGNTPLECAIKRGRGRIVRLLQGPESPRHSRPDPESSTPPQEGNPEIERIP